jgi:hypothetical protein
VASALLVMLGESEIDELLVEMAGEGPPAKTFALDAAWQAIENGGHLGPSANGESTPGG